MKKSLLALLLLLSAVAVHADPFDDFATRVRADLVKPFALDLGGILGGAASPAARPLGFPGFSIGVTAAGQVRPDKDDRIMRDAGVKAFGLPFVEAGLGLPLGIDVIAHGTKIGDFQMLGGGLRATLFKAGTITMAIPSLSVSAFGDKVDHDYFDAMHYAANIGAIWNKLPIVHPFISVGGDSTKVEVNSSAMVTSGAARGVSATAKGYRGSVGVDISPLPLLHFHLAYALRHGIPGADAGLTFSF